MDRADKQRYYAWAPLYADLVDTELVDEKNAKEVEAFISEKLPHYPPSGRLKRMIAMIKAARKHNLRFILVSDRLFLVRLAYEVSSFYKVFLTFKVCVNHLHLKVGVITGAIIYDNQANETNRSYAINGINSGALDGIVMTAQTGGCGHNIPGAQLTLFMSSLYIPAEERQVICSSPSVILC